MAAAEARRGVVTRLASPRRRSAVPIPRQPAATKIESSPAGASKPLKTRASASPVRRVTPRIAAAVRSAPTLPDLTTRISESNPSPAARARGIFQTERKRKPKPRATTARKRLVERMSRDDRSDP
jgi:hypothetical protein